MLTETAFLALDVGVQPTIEPRALIEGLDVGAFVAASETIRTFNVGDPGGDRSF